MNYWLVNFSNVVRICLHIYWFSVLVKPENPLIKKASCFYYMISMFWMCKFLVIQKVDIITCILRFYCTCLHAFYCAMIRELSYGVLPKGNESNCYCWLGHRTQTMQSVLIGNGIHMTIPVRCAIWNVMWIGFDTEI